MPKFMKNMNVITRCMARYRVTNLKLDGINANHHSYFLTIYNNPALTQDALASNLGLNKSTVARVLSALEELGYVRRQTSDADKRQTLVYPTEKLENVIPRVKEITRSWNEKLCEGIDREDMEIFHSVLERMAKKARELAEDSDR